MIHNLTKAHLDWLLDKDMRLGLCIVLMPNDGLSVLTRTVRYQAFITADIEKYKDVVQRISHGNDTLQAPLFTQAFRANQMSWYPKGFGVCASEALEDLSKSVEDARSQIQDDRYLEMVRAVGTSLTFSIEAEWKPPMYSVLSQTDEWMIS